jgi:hypothetical protein
MGRERANQISREERDKIRKLKNAFVNYRPLDNMVSSIVMKFGLRLRETYNNDQTKVDPEALLMLSEGLRMKLDSIVRELIKVNRATNSLSFVRYK